jgi:hypothetical protein
MDNSSPQVTETTRFKKEVRQLLKSDRALIKGLIWALTHDPFLGQQVKNSDQRVWVLFHGGYAYLAYYTISGNNVTLNSLLKRETPIAPGPLGIEP